MSKTVAVIGASSDRNKYGNKALRAFERQGYTVIPINPNEAEVEGHKAFARVLEVPGPITCDGVHAGAQGGRRHGSARGERRARGVAQSRRRRHEVVARAHALGLRPSRRAASWRLGSSPGDTQPGECPGERS